MFCNQLAKRFRWIEPRNLKFYGQIIKYFLYQVLGSKQVFAHRKVPVVQYIITFAGHAQHLVVAMKTWQVNHFLCRKFSRKVIAVGLRNNQHSGCILQLLLVKTQFQAFGKEKQFTPQ